MFHIDSIGIKMHTNMPSGANEVHSGCLVLSFPMSHDFVRVELIELIASHRRRKFHTGSDIFKMHADMAKGAKEVYSRCLALSFNLCRAVILNVWNLSCSQNPTR